MNTTSSREELALNLYEAEWQWLLPHLERGALITVDAAIDLAVAGERIAADDTQQVGEWVASGLLAKPADTEITGWDKEPAKKFLALIISPYVLIQEIN